MVKTRNIRHFYPVNVIRKIQPIKPSAEKIFQYLCKIDKTVEIDLLFVNIDALHRKDSFKIEGEDENESIFITKSFDEFTDLLKLATDVPTNSTHKEFTKLETFVNPAKKK